MNLKARHLTKVFLPIIIISILFVWNEKFNFDGKIDHVKIANYFTSLAAIAGLTTLYFLYQQHIIGQQSFKPILQPVEKEFNIHVVPNFSSKDKMAILVSSGSGERSTEAVIIIRNIGLGIAKDASYCWEYDKGIVHNLIEKVYSTGNGNELARKNIGFIGHQATVEIPFPKNYMACFVKRDMGVSTKVPELILKIEYYDLKDNINVRMFNATIDYSDALGRMLIEFKEKI